MRRSESTQRNCFIQGTELAKITCVSVCASGTVIEKRLGLYLVSMRSLYRRAHGHANNYYQTLRGLSAYFDQNKLLPRFLVNDHMGQENSH